jgi:hypothetical protein
MDSFKLRGVANNYVMNFLRSIEVRQPTTLLLPIALNLDNNNNK